MPVVVMSAMTAPAVDRCIPKPVDLHTLLDAVHELCPKENLAG
jgi:hypothetical protein